LVKVVPSDGEASVSASSGGLQHSATYRESGCRRVFLKPQP
jgi:hypothetical protein